MKIFLDFHSYFQGNRQGIQKLKHKYFLLQVTINYASGARNTEIKETDAEVVKYIALG